MQICPGSRNGKQNKVRCLLKHNILPINKGKLDTPQVLYNLVSNSAPLKEALEDKGRLGEKEET